MRITRQLGIEKTIQSLEGLNMIDKNTAIETYKFNKTLSLSSVDFKKTMEIINKTAAKYDNDIAYIFYKDLVNVIKVKLELMEINK